MQPMGRTGKINAKQLLGYHEQAPHRNAGCSRPALHRISANARKNAEIGQTKKSCFQASRIDELRMRATAAVRMLRLASRISRL